MSLKLNLTEQKVLTFLETRNEVTTKETADYLDISEATVRRIFEHLAQLSLVERMHGGAQLRTSSAQIRNFLDKDKRNNAEKTAIAKSAARVVKKRDLVFLNSGSTTLRVPSYISSEKVHIVTNNMQLITQNIKDNIVLTLLGGSFDKVTRSSTGLIAINALSTTFSSLTILGTNGLHPIHGITSNSLEEVELSQKMIENTIGKIIVLADHEKVNRIANHQVCPIDAIDIIITDNKTDSHYIREYEERGIEVIIANK